MALQLEAQSVRWPDGAPRSRLIDATPITIGRDPACDWVLSDPGVSPRHAQIRPTATGFEVEALTSTGITAVNDSLRTLGLHQCVPLRAGDTLFVHAYKIAATDAAVQSSESAGREKPTSPGNPPGQLGVYPESVVKLLDEPEPQSGRGGSRVADDRFPKASFPGQALAQLPEGFTFVLVLEAEGQRWPNGARRTMECRSGHLEIGREPPCDWILPDKHVSARHARISCEDGEFVLEALSGTNKTAVNDPATPLNRHVRVALSDQDMIYVDVFRIRAYLRPERKAESSFTPQPSQSSQPETKKPDTVSDSPATLADILSALGLEGNALGRAGAQSLLRSFESLVEGLQQLLRAWADIRTELHLNRSLSMLDQDGLRVLNGSSHTVLRALLTGQPAPVAPEFFAVAFRELREHQLALLEGLRTGVQNMMRQLDPETIARRSDARERGFSLESADARRWRDFVAYMQELRADREHGEFVLFGEAFAQGYQEAIDRMRLLQRAAASPASPATRER